MASPPHSVEVRTPGDSPRPTAALLSPSVAAPQPSIASRLLLLLTAAVAAATAFVLLRRPSPSDLHCSPRKDRDLLYPVIHSPTELLSYRGRELLLCEIHAALHGRPGTCCTPMWKSHPRRFKVTGYTMEDVLMQEPKAGILKPAFTILLDRDKKSILLLIRGTHSIRDTLTTATGAVVPFHHTIVQEGGVSDLVLGYALRALSGTSIADVPRLQNKGCWTFTGRWYSCSVDIRSEGTEGVCLYYLSGICSREVLKGEAYAAGDLGVVVHIAYFRMDEMMRGQRGWRELQALGDKINQFSGIIEGLIWSPKASDSNDRHDDWAFEEET
uniref:Uncharacterized protein n=1 Tax=Zea mays TaxID=4577 RepID=A0A804Q448_MAIZE